ncbi:MAG: hypothetical protein FWG50_02540 [Kiritimatiellaeota bacterium]|nr:hypothetical protein [Kiritimatiellota bacterium]
MKESLVSLALFAAVAAITGCQQEQATVIPEGMSTAQGKALSGVKPAAMTPAVYASLTSSAKQGVIADELRTIGKAIKAYRAKHNGKWPGSLTALVTEGLLPAKALVSASDPTGGKEGGVPKSYDQWQKSEEADEPDCSFLYELCSATAKWDWKSYLAGSPSVATVDLDKDGEVSWQEAKLWHLARGDTTQASPGAYPLNRFPVVRCYWYGYPGSKDDTKQRSVISLAADLETVFLSQPWWEKDDAPVTLP